MGEQKLFSRTDIFGNYFPKEQLELDGEDIGMIDDGTLWILDNESQYPPPGTQFSVSQGPFNGWACSNNQLDTFMFDGGLDRSEGVVHSYNEPGPAGSRPPTPDLDRRSSSIDSGGEELAFLSVAAGLPSVSAQASSVDVTHQAESRPRWLCAECQEQFRTSQNLESHARAAGHRAYVCKECKKGFPRRDTYVRHAATHRPSGVHTCLICQSNNKEAVFKRKDHLHQHERNIHPDKSQPIIRRRPGNLRTDRYGMGDDIAPVMVSPNASRASSLSPAGWSPNSESYWDKESQDVRFVLGSILGSTASAVQFIGNPADMECASERARLVRGLARLALLPPDQLSHKKKEQLYNLLHELDEVESPI